MLKHPPARVDPEPLPDTPEFRQACENYVRACHRENSTYAALLTGLVLEADGTG